MIVFNALVLAFALFTNQLHALPEPAAVFMQPHPHQVSFVIPETTPPYGKVLPPSSFSSSSSRSWEWTHWLTDAKSLCKSLLGKTHRTSHKTKSKTNEEERNVRRFENDIVLRVNISSLADRIAINELAEVFPSLLKC